MKEELIKAYTETDYEVLALGLTINVGRENRKLSHIMKQRNWNSFLIITAWNPQSTQTATDINRKKNNELLKDLLNMKAYVFPSIGNPKDLFWEGEESWIAFNLNKKEGIELGNRYSQHAIVFGQIEQEAELVIC